MFILRPFKTSLFTKDDIGTVEEVVKGTRLVDKGIEELTRFSRNAPSFEPERRKFLKHAAVLAGLYATGQLLKGCATVQEPVTFQGKTYGGWEAHLLTQDVIRGPKLLIHPSTGLPSGFEHHKGWWINQGWGAVDYDVPLGTPIVPTANAYSSLVDVGTGGNTGVILLHSMGYNSRYYHLDGWTNVVNEGKPVTRRGFRFMDRSINKSIIVAFSGNTGIGPGGSGRPDPHVHFDLRRYRNSGQERLSLDPFTLGIDVEKPYGGIDQGINYGGRPVYWDGRTAIYGPKDRKVRLQQSLDSLEKRVKESDLDAVTKQELFKRHNGPEELRDYLGHRVLLKRGHDGKEAYEFMPGSLMYSLMLQFYSRTSKQEFIAMLPFIFPPLKPVYQKANPGVQS